MGTVADIDLRAYAAEMEENDANIRKMVLDSFQDMKDGKGRDYKEFFAELESRYTTGRQSSWDFPCRSCVLRKMTGWILRSTPRRLW